MFDYDSVVVRLDAIAEAFPAEAADEIGGVDEKHGVFDTAFFTSSVRNPHAIGIVYDGNSRKRRISFVSGSTAAHSQYRWSSIRIAF